MYKGMAPTRPVSLNKCNGSELSNAASISPCYNDIHEIAKTPISPSSSFHQKMVIESTTKSHVHGTLSNNSMRNLSLHLF